ncbi:pteridine reductase [Candidatus Rariloculus sp.]|uniref:pteridine reductase n=1 Tax=Candidatus Rariloculus sp. TaxID=3101265 RepID=UPI003D0CAC36
MAVPETSRSLAGRWALVTGAAKRIGATIAAALHDAGANVAIHYFNSAEPADALAARLNRTRPRSALAIGADLRNISALDTLVSTVTAYAGRLDVLVNNASSFYPTPLASVTEQQWHDLIDCNLKAPLFLCQAALPHLKASNGVIVNIVDVHSQRPLRNHPVYGAAKAGLAMLTSALAKDLGPDIRVNGVSPGAILWPEAGLEEKVRNSIIRQIPLRRPGEPEDIAAAVLFLVRDAPYVTGQIIAVDGGRSVGW